MVKGECTEYYICKLDGTPCGHLKYYENCLKKEWKNEEEKEICQVTEVVVCRLMIE